MTTPHTMCKPLLLLLIIITISACGSRVDKLKSDPSIGIANDQNLRLASQRWKADRNAKDFQILRSHLPPGVSTDQVEFLLGEPQGHTQDDGKEYFEYVIAGTANESSAWTTVFDERGSLIEWHQDR